ncbi:MAG TPA: N-acetyltransferase [Caulobacteraceae bacterium]
MAKDVSSDLVIAPEAAADAAEALALVDRAFGPGRYAKSAERLREGNHHLPELSFVAREDGAVVGTVRLWPVRVGGAPALLLGPIAVDPAARRRGLGAALAARACEAAAEQGHARVVLAGDLSFFERIGFEAPAPGRIRLPGPADPRRILIRALTAGAWDEVEGEVTLP